MFGSGWDPGGARIWSLQEMLEAWRRMEAGVRAAAAPLVERPRLLKRLQTARTPVAVLNAPTGYGKSVLLAQWAKLESRRVEAIMLGGEHNDPILLLEAIAAAMDRIEPLPDEVGKSLGGATPDVEQSVLPGLREAVADREVPFVLMLDDFEELESPDSVGAIVSLGRSFPARSQLVLATRSDPGLRIGRLRAHRGLIELGPADLTMNKAECQELIAGLGLEPSAEQLDQLVRHTEGWPAALYLAGLALRDAPDLGRAIHDFSGDDRIVVDYINEELLVGLSRRRLEFLRRVSVAERLCGGLCDALLDRTGSASVLRDLSHSNMPLIPLDRRDEWYRFHPLLRDTLRAELHRVEPELEAELHRRASDWWAECGETDPAINHAIEARAWARTGELIWGAYLEYSSGGRQASIKRWLDRIGPDGIASDPYLSLVAAYDAVARGASGDADHWRAVSRRLSADPDVSPAGGELTPALALLSASLGRDGVETMIEDATSAAIGFGEASPWIATCFLLVGVGRHLQGRRDSARMRLGEGARHAGVVSPTVQVLCLSQLALLAIEEEDWPSAEVPALQARAQLERSGIGQYPVMALGLAVAALVGGHTGHLERAATDLRQALKLLEQIEEGAAWHTIETRIVLARTALRLDDPALASQMLEEGRRLMRQLPDGGLLGEWIDHAEAAVATVSASGVTNLTPAELRVLQHMPTHLSIAEIAETIFVSSNTVKTQAHGIYRKLGVSSRREAVDEARRLGLIDDS
jgi:LuxR family maltose regulon positive regulatory protein